MILAAVNAIYAITVFLRLTALGAYNILGH